MSKRPKKFYKYCTFEAAKKILESGAFRWSSPLYFNDPFDHQYNLKFSGSPESCRKEIISILKQYYRGEKNSKHDPSLQESLQKIKIQLPHLKRKKLNAVLEEGFSNGVSAVNSGIEEKNRKWREEIKSARVFCITESRDNKLMWAHYAEGHEGLVIEITPLNLPENPLLEAKPITYVDAVPCISSWLDLLMTAIGEKPRQGWDNRLYDELAYKKSKEWSYEKEWRCIVYDENDLKFSDICFCPEEISAVYLGCRMSESHKKEIIDITAQRYSNSSIFFAETASREFRLVFKRRKGNSK